MFKKSNFVAGCFLAMTSNALAGETLYDCAPGNIEARYGWIAPRVLVIVDEEEKTALVMDGYTRLHSEDPIAASYSELNNGNFRVKWKVSGIPVRNEAKGSATWSATIDPKKPEMRIRAVVAGFENRPRGHGKCEVTHYN